MVSVAEIVRLHELRMQAHAALFDLTNRKERARSAAALVDLYFALARAAPPPLFIEAGARDASLSFHAREVLPEARIVAFEANPYNVEYYGTRLDHVGQRIEYQSLALADAPGELSFYILRSVDGTEQPQVIGKNSLLKRSAPDVTYEAVKVQAMRLDDHFTPAESENCCLWIDVEGGTGKVLGGAERVLRQTQLLMIELEDKPVWEGQWLAGQVLEFVYGRGLVPVARDFEWWPVNYNVICIRGDLLTRPEFRAAIDLFYAGFAKPPASAPQPPPQDRSSWQRFRSRVGRALPPRVADAIASTLRLR